MLALRRKYILNSLLFCLVSGCFARGVGHLNGPVQVYFNHNPVTKYTEPYRGIERAGDDLEAILERSILNAKSSVDIAVQELNLPRVAKALAAKFQNGARVRVILENQYSTPLSALTAAQVANLDSHQRHRYDEFVRLVDVNHDGLMSPDEIADRDSLVVLSKAGIRWIDDTADGSKGSGLMHHKFVIIDGIQAIVSSANFSSSDVHGDFDSPRSRGNANAMVVFESTALSSLFSEEFEILWSARFGLKKPYRPARTIAIGDSTVGVQFSPVSKTHGWDASVNAWIEREILQATHSADLALFVFSEQRLSDALEHVHNQGATVRALVDPSFAYRGYSECLDMMGLSLLDDKCRYETGNRPWKTAIDSVGIPLLPEGDKLHHKFAVIDARRTLFGSHNWSNAANRTNDETFLVISSDTIASWFQDEFLRIYQSVKLGPQPWLLKKISERKTECGL